MNLNRATLIGNLTRDPEVRTTPSGASVASFSIATNYIWTDPSGNRQEKAEFHNIVAWRKLADICGQYLHKGSKVYIEGRLQTRSWDDQTGNKRYITEIVAENLIMLDSKGASRPATSAGVPLPDETPTIQIDESDMGGNEEIKVEEVPF
ncbi:single-stranded DNA-binding protein [Candidatus Kuenenbacteria bacterium]|nr:single-stranded DNA-binding protein [Candidatus Kuenenbacteria bacterium]